MTTVSLLYPQDQVSQALKNARPNTWRFTEFAANVRQLGPRRSL